MSALARILNSRGVKIYGSDLCSSKLIDQLQEEGMVIRIDEKALSFVKVCDAVVYTSAVSKDNLDIKFAKKIKKPIFSRAQLLGELSKEKKTISVAGSHGKTTTTGMIANCLLQSNKDPSIHVGGILNNINSNVKIGKSDIFVTEACEYKDSFLHLKNFISVILNVEEDHLDYFKNLDNIFSSFNQFIQNTSKDGVIIYNYDEKYSKLEIPINSISFGFDEKADVHAKNIKIKNGKYSFDLIYLNNKIGKINLPCYAKHNILNALASCAVCIFLGLSFKEIKRGLENFKGIERRFQILRAKKGVILHDYAHHPHEIQDCLKTCREINKNSRLICVFQPHTFTRTRDLYDDFLKCFNYADEVWLLPIYPAREKPIENVSSEILAHDLEKSGVKSRYFQNFEACKKAILFNDKKKTTIAILGAGDIINLANIIEKV